MLGSLGNACLMVAERHRPLECRSCCSFTVALWPNKEAQSEVASHFRKTQVMDMQYPAVTYRIVLPGQRYKESSLKFCCFTD